jgi:L-seryl-tRNA(Ser) seleniumtransferase
VDPNGIYDFSGLERRLPLSPEMLQWCDDELAQAMFYDDLQRIGLEHMGGQLGTREVVLLNRVTGGLFTACQVLVEPGSTVIGVSPSHSHPAVARAVRAQGANFIDVTRWAGFERVVSEMDAPTAIVMTRLAVTYDILDIQEIERIVSWARGRSIPVILDEAGGARVGPAILSQPRSMQLGADLAVTALDKYGTRGPRLGLMVASADIAARVRSRAFQIGTEARPLFYPAAIASLKGYEEAHVRDLVACTMTVGDAVRGLVGDRLVSTGVIVKILGESLLEMAEEHAGSNLIEPFKGRIAPIEATAVLSMLLLGEARDDHGAFRGVASGDLCHADQVHPARVARTKTPLRCCLSLLRYSELVTLRIRFREGGSAEVKSVASRPVVSPPESLIYRR